MKKLVLSISKIVLSVATVPLWFVGMFVGVGHLPNQATGEIVEVIFRHSMLENIGDLAHPVIAYIAMAIAAASAVMNAVALKYPDSRGIRIAANAAFGIAMGSFLILFAAASTVSRGY